MLEGKGGFMSGISEANVRDGVYNYRWEHVTSLQNEQT